MTTKKTGDAGEAQAAAYLRQQGYQIKARQYRHRRAELDLVCEAPDGTLVFVEVKTRTGLGYGRPEEAVTPAKRRHLVRAAQAYLYKHGLEDHPCRFDVVAIVQRRGHPPDVQHFAHAFEAHPDDLR